MGITHLINDDYQFITEGIFLTKSIKFADCTINTLDSQGRSMHAVYVVDKKEAWSTPIQAWCSVDAILKHYPA